MKSSLKFLFFFVIFSLQTIAQGTYYNSISTSSSTFISDLQARIRSPYTHINYTTGSQSYTTTIIPNFYARDTTSNRKVVTCVYSGLNYVYTPPFAWIGGSGVNADSGLSREHTWCHNWMPTNPADSPERDEYSDQHHLFPVNQNHANGVRNDHPLGIVATIDSKDGIFLNAKFGKNSLGETVYEPRTQHKGDAARAILYMAVRYDGIDGYRWTFDSLRSRMVWKAKEAPQDLQLLLDWHKQDPPDKWEVDRNNYIESIQKNRNPFIDHPEYVNYINFSNLTKLNPTFAAEPTNQPTALTVSGFSSSSLTVTWNGATGAQPPSGYLLEIYNSNDYFIPMDGVTYSDDTNITDGKGLVNVSSGTTTYTFNGLNCGTSYYIRVYPYNGSGSSINYKIDGTIAAVSGSTSSSSLVSEPTNYPNGFNDPTITTTSITIKWTDPTGTVLPSGYLIFANNSNIFTDPIDGVTYSDDTDLSDFSAQVNVAYGVQQFTFTNLLPATSYSFRLYPYNGTSCQRNYKTASFPQTLTVLYSTASNGSAVIPDVVVNEYFNGTTGVSEWFELLVLKDSLNMQGMKIRDYSSGGNLQNVNTPLQFLSIPQWENVRHGTFIVIFKGGTSAPSEDTSFSSKKVILSATNSTFFSPSATIFDISGTADAIEIYNAANTHIHALSHGTQPGLIASIPQPRGNVSGSSTSGNVVRFFNTSAKDQFNDNTRVQHSTTATMGAPNDAVQATFVNTVLPVELHSFFVLVQKNNVVLKWRTATESNNAGFEVEKSEMINGKIQIWKKIGFVDGNGSSPIPNNYSFEDKNLTAGRYFYRLKQIDRDGSFTYSNEVEAIIGTLPTKFSLEQNYPNPFNPTTVINYQLPVNGHVSLSVYDVIGRETVNLVNEVKEAGNYSVEFNASKLPSGMYFYKLTAGNFSAVKKMLLIK